MVNRKKSRKGGITVNFKDTTLGGNYKTCEEGPHMAELIEVSEKDASTGSQMFECVWEVTEGPSKGARIWDNIVFTDKSLWRLRALMECVGLEYSPDEDFEIFPEDLLGESGMIEVLHEIYDGKPRARIDRFLFDAETTDAEEEEEEYEEEYEEEEGEEEEEPEEEEEYEDEEEEEYEEEEEPEDEEEEEEEPPKKPAKKAAPKAKAKAPAPKAKAKAKAPAKAWAAKEGGKVKFDDGEGNTVKGVVREFTGRGKNQKAIIDTADDEEWTVDVAELSKP